MPRYCVTITGGTFEIDDADDEEGASSQAFDLCDVSIEEIEDDEESK